ncbi:hypothetical protein QE320_gp042 [Pseudomonas phage EM]|uniref:Uncharacterized protein n=1 Tax=Pseudomonas phage EM TaxID=2936914 RepID=A0AAE9HG10_9CAUD|nr:hypothetical protein QE320_gp042 [Pseudomonas phage EM]UPW35844.1 hypothetical protein EM_042 [Pseudomonas phage EM]
MKDVAGREISVGDFVAFCEGGTGVSMLIGEVVAINPKTVSLRAEAINKWSGKIEVGEWRRAGDSVCKIEEAV